MSGRTFRVIEGVMRSLNSRSALAYALTLSTLFAAQHVAPFVARAAPRLVKGPYLMDVRTDSVAVLFELDAESAAAVVVRTATSAETRVDARPAVAHEVVLGGLLPSTRYTYEVIPEGAETPARGSFTTAPLPGTTDTTRFLVYGDARTDAAAHARVVRGMREEAADFVMTTGDMVADGRDPADWQELFDATRVLYAELPVFPALGNHEAGSSGQGVPFYRHFVRTPTGPGDEAFYVFDYGPVRVLVMDSNQSLERGSPQRAWLESEARRARQAGAPAHLFAAIHHGPFSSGGHGPNEAIAGTDVEQLLRRAGVELIFEGHDHAFERGDVDGLKYVLSGGAGAPLYVTNDERPYQLAFEPSHHFVRVVVTGPRVSITAIRKDGSVLDACAFTKGGPWQCVGGPGGGRGRVVSMPMGFIEGLVRFGPQTAAFLVVALVVWLGVRRVRSSRANAAKQSAKNDDAANGKRARKRKDEP